MIQILCKNNKKTGNFEFGTTIFDIYNKIDLKLPYPPLCAYVNNRVEGLDFMVFKDKQVEFLDYTRYNGMKVYVRSLFMVLMKAVDDVYGDEEGKLDFEATVSNGYFFKLDIGHDVTLQDVERLKLRMHEIVEADMPFVHQTLPSEEAIPLFRKHQLESKALLMESLGHIYFEYYKLGDTIDLYYGPLVPSTGYLKLFDLVKYYDGIFLRVPEEEHPDRLCDIVRQDKMLANFKDTHKLLRITGLSTVGELNRVIDRGEAGTLIKVAEALQEKKIARIADDIVNRGNVRIVLIAGPSSSGKTTFSKRLSVQLAAAGKYPFAISLDDYFVDRDHTPLDEKGEYDYESIYALDLPFFNQQLKQILAGEDVSLPTYNFVTGEREFKGKHVRLNDNMILVLEGIHALNPLLTSEIPSDQKYKVFVSALTGIKLDKQHFISTTDNRLVRRIVRDFRYRGVSAVDTIKRWPSVRLGEEKWIIPFSENADVMFNSALLFELAVFKNLALSILENVREDVPQYSEAHHLKHFLRCFRALPERELPPTSLLREFLGGSTFNY